MKLVLCIAIALMPVSAMAFDCPAGEEGKLKPIRWSAKDLEGIPAIGLGVESTFDKAVVMADASVWFVDGLDRIVGEKGFPLDPDLHVNPEQPVITYLDARGAHRLVGARFEDFTAHICTRAVLFDDGTKAEF